MPEQTPVTRIGMQDVLRHRAVQAAFPQLEGNLTRPSDPLVSTRIELNIISSSSQPQDSKTAAAFCETACVFNPNTQNPEIRALRQSQNIEIECTGIQSPGGNATLLILDRQSVGDITTLAPCGTQLESTGIPAILLGRIPDTTEKPEIRKHPWYDPFGRFVERVIGDYTRNPDLLTADDVNAINDNTAKHVRSLRAATLALLSISTGLTMAQSDALNLLALTGSFGSMAAFGSAWFGISFGNIRREFFDAAVKTTENMLKPLEISMASTFAALTAGTTNHPFAAPFILGPFAYAFLCGIKSIIQYDTSDLFSAGLTNEHLEYLKRENQLLKSIGVEANLSPENIRERLLQWRSVLGSSQPAVS